MALSSLREPLSHRDPLFLPRSVRTSALDSCNTTTFGTVHSFNVCIHCAGAGTAPNVIQSISLTCRISLTSLVTDITASLSATKKKARPWSFAAPSCFCSGNMCHFAAAGPRVTKVAVASPSCQEEPGMALWSLMAAPSEGDENLCHESC